VETVEIGELVRVVGVGTPLDGLVFDTPSRSKAIVAVVDPTRGPVLRTVGLESLEARTQDGPDDPALRSLVRRTPQRVQGAAGGGTTGRKGSPGFSRGPAHRPTGR
jgi:hypothetical protein